MSIIDDIRSRASKKSKKVIFPEAEKDIRIIRAAAQLKEMGIADPVLLGDSKRIQRISAEHDHDLPGDIEICPVDEESNREKRFRFFEEKLAHKKPKQEQLKALCENPLFTGGWLLETGEADAAVAGSIASTSEVIVSAIRTVGVSETSSIVSSSFFMELPNGQVYIYADCGVVPYPDEVQLTSIALDAGEMNKLLTGVDPRIAFLSFSTKGSARHESVDKVRKAYEITSRKRPEWEIDGELQFDAAMIPAIAERKAPQSPLEGSANVFIFPNLDAGNIAYKITERLAGASATGPILQGLKKPYLDLSRGCTSDDIINTACVGILMSDKSE